jgi:hypothetical protein
VSMQEADWERAAWIAFSALCAAASASRASGLTGPNVAQPLARYLNQMHVPGRKTDMKDC